MPCRVMHVTACLRLQADPSTGLPPADELRPFQTMLQFAMEPLLAGSGPGADAGSALPALTKMMRTMRQMGDAAAAGGVGGQPGPGPGLQ